MIDLDQVRALADRMDEATPGPWHIRYLDDDDSMNLLAISTEPDTGLHERWPDFDGETMVAATLIQKPRFVSLDDGKWDENAWLIVAARNDAIGKLRQMADEIEALRAEQIRLAREAFDNGFGWAYPGGRMAEGFEEAEHRAWRMSRTREKCDEFATLCGLAAT